MAEYGPDPINFSEPESVYMRKAGEGALWDALRRSGWTDVQIHNGLRSHYASIMDEAADAIADPIRRTGLGWESARDVLRNMGAEARRGRSYGG